MDESTKYSKKIISITFIAVFFVIFLWLIVFPPIAAYDTNSSNPLQLAIEKALQSDNVYIEVSVDQIKTNNIEINNLANDYIMKNNKDNIIAYHIYINESKTLLVSLSEPWMLLEDNNQQFLLNSNNEVIKINNTFGPINPFVHMSNINLEAQSFNYIKYKSNQYYIASIVNDNMFNVIYIFKLSNSHNRISQLSILVSDSNNFMDIIQYNFLDWNKDYINDKLTNVTELININSY